MFIQTEQTPNPSTLKFIPGEAVMSQGTLDIATAQDAQRSPLASRLFKVDGVNRVFLGFDFVSVTKTDEFGWDVMKPMVLAAIMDHYMSGQPALLEGGSNDDRQKTNEQDDDITREIKDLIETRVRPAVAQDGGDIIFDRFEEGTVYLHLRGACSGCPSSTATLKSGIENMLRHYVPEVERVEAA